LALILYGNTTCENKHFEQEVFEQEVAEETKGMDQRHTLFSPLPPVPSACSIATVHRPQKRSCRNHETDERHEKNRVRCPTLFLNELRWQNL